MAIGCVFHILFANVQNIFCYTLAWFSKITSLFNHIVIYAQVCGCWSVDCCAWLLPTTDQITDFSRLLVLHLWPATWLPYSPILPCHKTVHNIPMHPQQHCGGCLITKGKCSRFSLPTAAAATCCIL